MKVYVLLCCLLAGTLVVAQNKKASLMYRSTVLPAAKAVSLSLFTRTTDVYNRTGAVQRATTFTTDAAAVANAVRSQPAAVRLLVPLPQDQAAELILVKTDAAPPRLGTLTGAGTQTDITIHPGLHYRGFVQGDSTSLAVISLFEDGTVMGLFSGEKGDVNIGKTTEGLNSYIAYYTKDVATPPTFACATSDDEHPAGGPAPVAFDPSVLQLTDEVPATLCNEIRFYWEGDYRLYNTNFSGNLTNTFNYLTGLFNQVAALYQNEGIKAVLAASYLWTTADPYPSNSSSAALVAFKNRWNGLGNSFRGDLAHLVAGGQQTSTGPNNGGVAYLLSGGLCNRPFAYGYSNVYGYYNTLPVYSWDVEVISHELGHNLGSNHTQWCGWGTDTSACGAIDNCYTLESTSTCSTCPVVNDYTTPGFKGTVMSYCHLRSGIGINLANGFGPKPQAVIRNSLNIASCVLKANNWTGATSTAWENAANWSCGAVPNATTEVYLPAGLNRYPIVSSATICYSIRQATGTSVKVNAGATMTVVGPPQQ